MAKRQPKKTLTAKQQKFLREFPKDLNACQAAIRAGYARKNAKVTGAKLCKMLKARLKEREVIPVQTPALPVTALPGTQANSSANLLAPATNAEFDRFERELQRLVFTDVRKFFDTHGNPIDIPSLGDDEAAVLAGFEQLEEFEGKGDSRKCVGYTKKYKLADKISAMNLYAKLKGWTREPDAPPPSPLEQASTAALVALLKKVEAALPPPAKVINARHA